MKSKAAKADPETAKRIAELIQRRAVLWYSLTREGYSLNDIALAYRVDKSTVCREIQTVSDETRRDVDYKITCVTR